MRLFRGIVVCLLAGLLAGCTARSDAPDTASVPPMPQKVDAYEDGAPLVDVYVTEHERIETMPLETYLYGVLAGEMKNDWPMEALKAQAILARTFVLKFMAEKESRYEGADISTDIEEAQAYDASAVNQRVRDAVDATRGLVLSSGGELPYAWFHAHSGGVTALAREGLNWKAEEPPYTRVTKGNENQSAAPDAAAWEAEFSAAEVIAAAEEAGTFLETLNSAEVGERGESGRAVTLLLSGQAVNAADLRIALGSTRMRSTLLTSLRLEGGVLHMAGKGFGHGVGMSQWGAYALAGQGWQAQDIVTAYFDGVAVVRMY